MDEEKKKCEGRMLLLSLLLILLPGLAFGFDGKVRTKSGEPVAGASVLLMKSDSTTAIVAVTDTLGRYRYQPKTYPATLLIRSMGFKTASLTLQAEPSATMETVMSDDETTLREVVVTPEMMQRYDSHNSYRIARKDLDRYATFSQSMNVIPFVNVSADGSVTYRGSSNIVLLLNGVRTTEAELRALDKGDVMKVDVYDNPPAQYALAGASAVINVITQRRLSGGNVAVDLSDSFYPVKGKNNISAFYNTGQSRFSLQLGNEMRHYKKLRTDETLSYELDGTEYAKTKTGRNSPYRRDNNQLSLGFMTHDKDRWQLNLNYGTSYYKYRRNLRQDIVYNNGETNYGENNLRNRYNKHSLNLYLSRKWKNNHQLLFDATGTLYRTHYASAYGEWDADGTPTLSSQSAYTSNRRSLLSTLQYSLPGRLGQWTFGLREQFQYNRQMQDEGSLLQRENTLFGYAQLYGHKGKIYYQLLAAAKYLHIRQNDRTEWARWYPSPTVTLWWLPSRKRRSRKSPWINFCLYSPFPDLVKLEIPTEVVPLRHGKDNFRIRL